MQYGTYKFFAIFMLYMGLSLSEQASAQEGNVLRSRLTSLTAQLESEQEAAQRTEVKLADAQRDFDATAQELAQEKLLASKGDNPQAERKVRIISVRYDRHKEKVERYKARVAEDKKAIAVLREDIRGVKDKLGKALQLERERKRRREYTAAKKALAVPAATPSPLPQRQARVVAKALPKPAGWPYLSEARDIDIAYAKQRLRARGKSKSAGPKLAISLTASDSFGTAVLTQISENLYSTVKPVKAGKQLFANHEIKVWHVIPQADDSKAYRIVVDKTNAAKPQLILFRESLLGKF